jgi:hypothetical protein
MRFLETGRALLLYSKCAHQVQRVSAGAAWQGEIWLLRIGALWRNKIPRILCSGSLVGITLGRPDITHALQELYASLVL